MTQWHDCRCHRWSPVIWRQLTASQACTEHGCQSWTDCMQWCSRSQILSLLEQWPPGWFVWCEVLENLGLHVIEVSLQLIFASLQLMTIEMDAIFVLRPFFVIWPTQCYWAAINEQGLNSCQVRFVTLKLCPSNTTGSWDSSCATDHISLLCGNIESRVS